MERIEVVTRADQEGRRIPASFFYRGDWCRVSDIGRGWVTDQGRHILVMVLPASQVFELLIAPSGEWYVVKGHDRPTVPLV
ncbi:MAG: hypothetical protein HYZ26_03015 [Chloroflexi bacterium]|nr:hypothetical protein [Chloroflexota bacterium]